ncbi:hypothetical protein GCM10009836_22100 [Pseudonocardia ailaonensis]|uniref:DUF4234 domain-containing protein n=1 Tax=Pseudonocardia ailaonensis TaxID=367279 RepID=A0ABN2MXP5_9PSEU
MSTPPQSGPQPGGPQQYGDAQHYGDAQQLPGLPYPQQQYAAPFQAGVPAPVPAFAPTGLAMKRRNPLAAWIGLPLITLGIYHFVWYYKIHREMSEFDRRREIPVAGPVLVLLLLFWTVVAPLVSYFNTGNRIADAQRSAGQQPTCNPWIGLVLCFFFGLQTLYYQVELNKVIDAYGVPAGSTVALAG